FTLIAYRLFQPSGASSASSRLTAANVDPLRPLANAGDDVGSHKECPGGIIDECGRREHGLDVGAALGAVYWYRGAVDPACFGRGDHYHRIGHLFGAPEAAGGKV